ncbi:MAG: TonB-dependent receptor [Agriterribacter sp.]
MRLTIFFLLAGVLNANSKGMSQTVTLKVNHARLEHVMKEIKDQTGLTFVYTGELKKRAVPVTLDLYKAPLEEALTEVFSNQPFSFKIVDNVVVINTKHKSLSEPSVSAGVGDHLSMLSPPVTITGNVTSDDGLPLAGASVKVVGLTNGASTDERGNFTLTLPADVKMPVKINVSYIGYETITVATEHDKPVRVILKKAVTIAEDIVVVGYGTQKKRNVTGAVATIKGDELDLNTSANVTQSLQGKVAGLLATQPTGQPGAGVSIQLRNNPSNANLGVLYVIDGVPVNDNPGTPGTAIRYGTGGVDQSPLNFINPNDIESISFLKDASAASIYGARAAAGVVLITTKKGANKAPTVRYSGNVSIQRIDRLWDLLGTKDYMIQRNLINEEFWAYNNKVAPYYGTVDPSTVTPYTPMYSQTTIDTTSALPSALDAVTRQGYVNQHNVSVSGGVARGTYFLSLNYFDQKGVLLASALKRYNVKLSVDQNLSDRFKIGGSILVSNSKLNNSNTGGLYENGGVFTAATYWPANLLLRGADGSYPLNSSYPNTPNPLSYQTVTDFTKGLRILSSGYAQWEFIRGLTAKTMISYDQAQNTRNSYYPQTFLYGNTVNGAAAIATNGTNSLQAEYTLGYDKNFVANKLNVKVLGGYSYQRTNRTNVGAGNQQFVSDAISYYNLSAGQATTPTVYSGQSQTTWLSEFARANFDWESKYFLQVSYRRDGASNFAENKKWAQFPSVSASWIASDEKFMKSVTAISFFKVRAGYGETGNSAFPGSAYALYELSSSPLFGNNQPNTGIKLTQAPSPNLTWETVGEYNLGLDFGLFKNRISGNIDIYTKTVKNMIVRIPLPADNLTSYVWGNAGKARTNGWEVSLTSKNFLQQSAGGFSWNTTINLSRYYSYWVERDAQTLANLKGTPWVAVTGRDASLDAAYGYVSAGFYNDVWGKQPSHMPGMLPGGIIVKDINGFDNTGSTLTGTPDGKITAADQTIIYRRYPKLIFGISNTFAYRNFDLNILLSGFIRDAWDPTTSMGSTSMQGRLRQFGWNVFESVKDRWTYQNPSGTLPAGISDNTYSAFQNNSDYFVVNGSFLRCRNITLGYSLTQTVLNRKVSAVRIYIDLQNIFTITSSRFKGMDPEASQDNYYPLSKSYTLGVNVTF